MNSRWFSNPQALFKIILMAKTMRKKKFKIHYLGGKSSELLIQCRFPNKFNFSLCKNIGLNFGLEAMQRRWYLKKDQLQNLSLFSYRYSYGPCKISIYQQFALFVLFGEAALQMKCVKPTIQNGKSLKIVQVVGELFPIL